MSNANPRPPERHVGDSCSCTPDEHLARLDGKYIAAVDGCWNWTLKPNKSGYGVLWHKGRAWIAHRFVMEVLQGRIADGMSLDHLCGNKVCVNPDHLEPVTYEVNTSRGAAAYHAAVSSGKRPEPQSIPRRDYRSRSNFPDDDPRHGTTTGYTGLGCRCRRCKDAHLAYDRAWKARRAGGAA